MMEQFLTYLWACLIAYIWNQAHERRQLASMRSLGSDDQWADWNRKAVTKLSLVTT